MSDLTVRARKDHSITHLIRECVDWYPKSPRQAKITELELSFAVYEQILRFEVAMQNLVFMTKSGSLQELEHEAPDDFGVKRTTIPILIHVLLQILLAKLENENKLCLAMDDVVEANDVGVFELLHQ